MSKVSLFPGDNRETLRRLIDDGVRVHSVVTDPPYGLVSIRKRFGKEGAAPARTEKNDGSFARLSKGFMNATWDGTGIERDPEFWSLIWEILLPGGYVFAFSGSRTGHWQACAMEQAGFIMHPMHGWVFGTGFPKAHNAAMAIDKTFGASHRAKSFNMKGKEGNPRADEFAANGREILPPWKAESTEAAQWEGWAYGTQTQKPALEPIYLGQKPFSEKTGAANLLKHGVGAVNIDGCRVPTSDNLNGGAYAENPTDRETMWGGEAGNSWRRGGAGEYRQPEGRHPANLILDGSPEVVDLFPSSTGSGKARTLKRGARDDESGWGMGDLSSELRDAGDGSAARFFHQFPPDTDPIIYHAKAGKADRGGSKHPCLLPGEEVLTDVGYRPIEAVGVGSRVFADDGTYRDVIDQFPSPADTVVYEIAVEGTNRTTTATGNHPFLTWRRQTKRTALVKGYASWQNAEDLRPGDYLMTPIPVTSGAVGSEDAIWWHVFGLWVAEGCKLSNTNGVSYPSITVAKARNSDLLPVIKGRFGSVSAYDRGACWQVVIFEHSLIDRFTAMAGYGAKGKRVGSEILSQPEWARKAFLEGYLRGDGCVVRGAWRASTASDDLAATMPLLASSLGLRCAAYRFDATGKDSVIDGRVVPGGVVHKLYFSKGRQIEVDGILYDLSRVKRVASREYVGPVWNITVEGRHTFQTRVGMSHNTVKPVALLQYLIRHITPPGGVVLDPFAGSGTTGEAAKREGFDCILMEAEDEYIEFLRKRFVDDMENGSPQFPVETQPKRSYEQVDSDLARLLG